MSHGMEQEKILLQPYNYIVNCGGKQIRTKLIQAFNHWFCIPEDKLIIISEIVEMLHNASIIIDDIEDNSILRRGVPVAHNIFGIASTINSANYVYFLTLEKIIKFFPTEYMIEAIKIFTEQLLELHRGQGMDIYWRDNYTCPNEADYLKMIRKKTGGLFDLAVRLMQLFSDNKNDFSELTGLLSVYFQIRDDYINLKSKEYAENKSYCEDLTEGKFSFPIIHAINSHPDNPTILNIVRQRTKDTEIKKFAVELMDKFGTFEYTLNFLRKIDENIRSQCANLSDNPYFMNLLEILKIDEDGCNNKLPK